MIAAMFKKGSKITSVELTGEACDSYNEKIQKRLLNTVWASCSSWYNHHGTNKVIGEPVAKQALASEMLRPDTNARHLLQ